MAIHFWFLILCAQTEREVPIEVESINPSYVLHWGNLAHPTRANRAKTRGAKARVLVRPTTAEGERGQERGGRPAQDSRTAEDEILVVRSFVCTPGWIERLSGFPRIRA